MKLFIVESPNKCAKIQGYLGSEYRVKASVGHIMEIPPKGGLQIDIKNGFEPTYQICPNKKDVVKELKELAKKSSEVILATDRDREGENISASIYNNLSKEDQKKCKRITFIEITEKAIKKALQEPRSLDKHLIDAQKARAVLDRIIGFRASSTLWSGGLPRTSAGRCQSVILKLLVDLEKEIAAFKPEDYWFLEALLKCKTGEFWAKVVTKNKDNKYIDEKIALADLEKLKKASFKIAKITRKEEKRNAYPPFDTASLQVSASSIFNWPASKTQTLAQNLYVAGLVSYIRSDSFNISEEALVEDRALIKSSFGDTYLPSKANIYAKKSSAGAQEAHECIRPTHIKDDGSDIDNEEEKTLYKLIRDRFIACQMNPMVVDVVEYLIKTNTGHNLIARGQTIKFDGWYKAYKYSQAKEEILPNVTENEALDLKDIKCTKHTTKPPARYKDGSLIKKMESEGVGRPSTRDKIIKVIQDRGYVEKIKGGAFKATDLGMRVCDFLVPRFKDFFMDIKYTAKLEEDLDEIATGKKTYLDVVQTVYDFLMQHIKDSKDMPGSTPREPPKLTGKKCSVCKDGDIAEKNGKFGMFFACTNYPKCKTIYSQDEDGEFHIHAKKVVKKVGRKCPECEKHGRDGELLERKSKKGSIFIGCSAYPLCHYSESIEEKENGS